MASFGGRSLARLRLGLLRVVGGLGQVGHLQLEVAVAHPALVAGADHHQLGVLKPGRGVEVLHVGRDAAVGLGGAVEGDVVAALLDRGQEHAVRQGIDQLVEEMHGGRAALLRLVSLEAYQEIVKSIFVVTPQLLRDYARKDMILMDPLPRVGTIDPAVDHDERAVYLKAQIRNGLYVRMALLALLMGKA